MTADEDGMSVGGRSDDDFFVIKSFFIFQFLHIDKTGNGTMTENGGI